MGELLRIEHLSVTFSMYRDIFSRVESKGIEDLSISLYSGEILAIVGASGSGKSLLAHAIMDLLPYNAIVRGDFYYQGEYVDGKRLEQLRGTELSLIPQSITYLDPTMKVGKQVIQEQFEMDQCKSIFAKLDLAEHVISLYPFQLSGGMARRVLVSTALISNASVIVADEPTPGMSVTDAVETLQMLREIANEGKGCILITHDLDLAVEVADRVAVMYDGRIIDIVSASNFKRGVLTHPYTNALYRALPQNDFKSYTADEVESFLRKGGNQHVGSE